MDVNKPLWMMTAGEFVELLKTGQQPVTIEAETNLVYGMAGLADLLKVSKATAQKIKNSGVIKDATMQFGRSISFDREKVLELMKKRKI